MGNLKIEYVDINSLRPNEYNPKKMSPKEVADLKASIVQFGMVDPIIVNMTKRRKNVIIGGHQRWQVCKGLGHKTIPVVFVDILDPTREKELCLRLTKNVAKWDWSLLANFDESLLKQAGFTSLEIEPLSGEFSKIDEKEVDEENVGLEHKCPKCGYQW